VDPTYTDASVTDVENHINKCLLVSKINTHIAFALQNSDFVDITRNLQDYKFTDNTGKAHTLQIVRYDYGCMKLI